MRLAVGQRMRHSMRRRRRAFDVWKAHWPSARRGGELDVLDLDILALARPLEHVVERGPGVPERVSPVRNDDCRVELHTNQYRATGNGGRAAVRRLYEGRPDAAVLVARHRHVDGCIAAGPTQKCKSSLR